MSAHTHEVNVIEIKTGNVVKGIPVSGARKAQKVASGVEINLNHDEYIVSVEPVNK